MKGLHELPTSYERKTAIEALESFLKERQWTMHYRMLPDTFEADDADFKIIVSIRIKFSRYRKVFKECENI